MGDVHLLHLHPMDVNLLAAWTLRRHRELLRKLHIHGHKRTSAHGHHSTAWFPTSASWSRRVSVDKRLLRKVSTNGNIREPRLVLTLLYGADRTTLRSSSSLFAQTLEHRCRHDDMTWSEAQHGIVHSTLQWSVWADGSLIVHCSPSPHHIIEQSHGREYAWIGSTSSDLLAITMSRKVVFAADQRTIVDITPIAAAAFSPGVALVSTGNRGPY